MRFSKTQTRWLLRVFCCNAGNLPFGEGTTRLGRWLWFGNVPNEKYPNSNHGHTLHPAHWSWESALLLHGLIVLLVAKRRMHARQRTALEKKARWLAEQFNLHAVDQLAIIHRLGAS